MDLQRYCPCGKKIAGKRELCPECLSTYGDIRKDWPAWLLFAVNDFQNQYKKEIAYFQNTEDFDDIAGNGDLDDLLTDETYTDKDRLLILRGCRQDTFALT